MNQELSIVERLIYKLLLFMYYNGYQKNNRWIQKKNKSVDENIQKKETSEAWNLWSS